MNRKFLVPMTKEMKKAWKACDMYSRMIDRVLMNREAEDYITVIEKTGNARANAINLLEATYLAPAVSMRNLIDWTLHQEFSMVMLDCEEKAFELQQDFLAGHQIPYVCSDGSASDDGFGNDADVKNIMADYMSFEKEPMGFQGKE